MYVTYKNMVDPANPNDPNVRVLTEPKEDDMTPAMLLWGMMAVNVRTFSNDPVIGLEVPANRQEAADATGLSPYAIDQFVAMGKNNVDAFQTLSDLFQGFAHDDNGGDGDGAGYIGDSCPGTLNPLQNLAKGIPSSDHTPAAEDSDGRVTP